MRYFKFVTADGCSKMLTDPTLAAPPPTYQLPLVFPPRDPWLNDGPQLLTYKPYATRNYEYYKTIDAGDGDAIVIYREKP